MAAIPVLDYIANVIEDAYVTLKSGVETITKNLQEYADSIAPDPDDDNSHLAFNISRQFYSPFYFGAYTRDFTDVYDGSDKGYGQQPWLCYGIIEVNNETVSNHDFRLLGRMPNGNRWDWVTVAEQESIKELVENTLNSLSPVFTPDNPVYFRYNNSLNGFIVNSDDNSNIQFSCDFPRPTTITKTSVQFSFNTLNIVYDEDTNFWTYIPTTMGIYACPVKNPLICVTAQESFAADYVSNNGATNNYVDTYLTLGGNLKIYYGDNYIIYVVPSGVQVTYDIMFNATKQVTQTINQDNPNMPQIVVPTYNENKYGPEPEPSELVSDNQEDGGNYNHAEFTKVYACTSAELNDLYQWMGGGAAGSSGTSPVTVPDSFDPMNRIVGLIGYPMVIDVGVGDQTTFTFRNAANQTINTGWSTYKYGNFDRAFDFGTVDIPNWEEVNNGAPFLDYSATVEIYIPFCGVVGLDPQAVMGCTLSCKMWIDFLTGDCSAVVYTNYGGEDAQHPVAFVSGNCGSAEVVSANAFGAYQGAKAQASHKMSQAILGGFKDLATSVIGGATTGFTRGAANPSGTGGNAGMRAGAIGSVIGGAMNLGVNLTLQNLDNRYAVQVAKNALGTTISGSFGQQTSWYYMDTPYIKVTWPTPISKDVELYGKTFGVPVHRSGTLSEFTGYTVCNNVDVSGITGATASELAIIKQFLETGVFIKEGGEE